jgi:hypothetical protein
MKRAVIISRVCSPRDEVIKQNNPLEVDESDTEKVTIISMA